MKPGKVLIAVAVLLFVLLACAVSFCIGMGVQRASDIAENLRSECRFAQLEFLLRMYYREHGHFPPKKYQPTADGATHSWRLLLLRYVDVNAEKWFSEYDFTKSWDDLANARALQGLDRFGRAFFSIDGRSETTNYLAIDEDDPWPSSKPLKALLIEEGKDRFLIVEVPTSTVRWFDPEF